MTLTRGDWRQSWHGGGTYTLYHSTGACSLAVKILLEEIGAPYELKRVSAVRGETGEPAYLAINPKGRVPALAIGGAVLTEVPAILTFLAERHEREDLFPATALGRARCLEWLAWLASEVHPAFVQVWRPRRSSAALSTFGAIRQQGYRNVCDRFDEIERLLAGGGNDILRSPFTIVDPYLLVFFNWGEIVGLDMARYRHWANRNAAVATRPAVARALSSEGGL